MELQILFGEWIEIFDKNGDSAWISSADVSADPKPEELEMFMPNSLGYPIRYERKHGFGVRLSRPGYIDSTEWTVFPSYKEAVLWGADLSGQEIGLERSISEKEIEYTTVEAFHGQNRVVMVTATTIGMCKHAKVIVPRTDTRPADIIAGSESLHQKARKYLRDFAISIGFREVDLDA